MRRIAVGALLVGVLAATLTASALARSSAGAGAVTAIDVDTGRSLPADPVLHRGERVKLTVRGFAPRHRVTIVLVGVRTLATVLADRSGHARYRYTVPRSMHNGRHELIFSGPARSLPRPRPSRRHGSRTRDPQAFVVTVPFDPPWHFRLGGAARHPSPRPSPTVRGVGGEHGGTSFTGVDLAALLLAAALLLGAGVAVTTSSRRARRGTNGGTGETG